MVDTDRFAFYYTHSLTFIVVVRPARRLRPRRNLNVPNEDGARGVQF